MQPRTTGVEHGRRNHARARRDDAHARRDGMRNAAIAGAAIAARRVLEVPRMQHLPAGSRRLRTTLAAAVRLGRLKFLLYSGILTTLGALLALRAGGELDALAYVKTLGFIWCVHVMTHYCNEYFDFEADAANTVGTGWTGGSRVLVEGLLPRHAALYLALAMMTLAAVIAAAMPPATRWLAATIVVLSWFYTAPPLQLNYRGLGELTVTTVLNGLVPLLGYVAQTRQVDAWPLLVMLPSGLIQFTRMNVMNLADSDGDRRAGKRTLVVRLGHLRSVQLHAFGQGLAYVLLIPAVMRWRMPIEVAFCVALTLPLSLRQSARVWRLDVLDPARAHSVAFWASTHVALVILATFVGLLIDTRGTLPRLAAQPGVAIFYVVPALALAIMGLQIRREAGRRGRAA